MQIEKGSSDRASAVADFWNAQAHDPESWWYGSPATTGEEIADLLARGFSLVVALEGDQLIGFGIWNGPDLIGFTATNADAFYRMMQVWCLENPGQRGLSVIPARDTTEKQWMDALDVIEVSPLGYKPLKPGDDQAVRKPWTYRADANLDAMLAALDMQLAEMSS
jgi:hypothetical protein